MPKDNIDRAIDLAQKRIDCNREILKRLTVYLETYPDIRFSQALVNLNIVASNGKPSMTGSDWTNEYYTEPEVILKRMKE